MFRHGRRLFSATAAAALANLSAESSYSSLLSACEEHQLDDGRLGRSCKLLVSLPSSYNTGAVRYPVLYVLDADHPCLFSLVATAARYGRLAAVAANRSYFPDFIVVGVSQGEEQLSAPPSIVTSAIVEHVDFAFRTRPYAEMRALLGYGRGADSVIGCVGDEATSGRFGHLLIGSPTGAEALGAASSRVAASSAPAPAVYLAIDGQEGDAMLQAVRGLHVTLEAAAASADATAARTRSVVRVDRDGTQHVESVASTGAADEGAQAPPVTAATLHVLAGEAPPMAVFAFAAHAVGWLGSRMEREKIARLHRHLPWHEFR